MKLNEADFAAFASSTTALDKAGWLWKRGAEFSHLSPTSSKSHLSQFKKRWFVLKGNLLFYFKHKTASTPVGMILLENCQVTSGKDGIDEANTQDFFHFELTFTHHLSAKHGRQYQLLAESPEDCQQWCKSISNASLVQSRTVAQKLWDRCHQNKRVIDQLVGQIRDLQTLVDHYDQQQHPRQIHARADIGKTGAGSDGEQMLSPDLTATDNDLEQMRESLNGIVRNLRSLFDREDADEETIRQQRNPTSSATTVIQSKTRSSTTASHSDQHQSLSVPGRLSSSLSHNLSNGSPIRLSSGSGNLILPSTVLNSSIEINKENKPSGNLTIQPSTAATAMMTRSSTINEKQQHSGLSASFTAQSGMAAPLNFSKTAVRSTARPQSLLSSSLPSSVNHTGVPPSPPALLTRSLSRRRSGESGVGSGLPPRFSALSMAMTSSSASDRISARSSTTIPERASAELSSGSPLRLNIGRTATAEEPQQSIASPTTSSSSSISSPTSGDSRTESREVGLPFPGFPPSIDDLSESAVHRPTAHDISFSCRLNPEIVSLMRNVSTSTITNNLVGSLVNGSTRNPETMIIMHERRFKRTDFGDDWGWYEIGRTELAELKVCISIYLSASITY
jgi:hypothetical protein